MNGEKINALIQVEETISMTTYNASIELSAPLGEVHEFFLHFTDFPKFIDFIEAITYHDRLRSKWVTDIMGQQEWIAVNEQWIAERELTWRSKDDLRRMGKIMFETMVPDQTRVTVAISYQPVANDDTGELLGAGKYIERALQYDLNQFAAAANQSSLRLIDPDSPLALLQSDIATHETTHV